MKNGGGVNIAEYLYSLDRTNESVWVLENDASDRSGEEEEMLINA